MIRAGMRTRAPLARALGGAPSCSTLAGLMSVFARFVAFEAIGWIAAAAVLTWAVGSELIPEWGGWTLFGLWVAKDFVLFPLTRRAYEHGIPHGGGDLIGAEAVVELALDPEGWVRAGHERWRARLAATASAPIDVGERVRIRALDGLTLVVELHDPSR